MTATGSHSWMGWLLTATGPSDLLGKLAGGRRAASLIVRASAGAGSAGRHHGAARPRAYGPTNESRYVISSSRCLAKCGGVSLYTCSKSVWGAGSGMPMVPARTLAATLSDSACV